MGIQMSMASITHQALGPRVNAGLAFQAINTGLLEPDTHLGLDHWETSK